MSPGEERSGASVAAPAAAPPPPTARTASVASSRPFPPLYRLLRGATATLLPRWFDLTVSGLEHLPSADPFILASNHHNYLDGVVLGVAVPRPIAFMVMPRVYRASPLHPALHQRIGSIPIDLERPDVGAIKRALRVLAEGGVLGIFPEGPFSREGRLVPGQPGVIGIAQRAGVPVIPAAIHGTYEALVGRRFHIPRRRPLAVRFGRPLHLAPPGSRALRRPEREEATRRLMDAIKALLEDGGLPARVESASAAISQRNST